ncbi:MAG: hypothetical protein IPL46_18370 [Saprospiraceae bacterium]|nr:hypothetical protein [Saprospiraceae bacterium]
MAINTCLRPGRYRNQEPFTLIHYAIINDSSTLNREVGIRANKINQNDLIDTWENLSGKSVKKIPVSVVGDA